MEDKKKIGWFCSYVPEELIMASGLEPVKLKGKVYDSPVYISIHCICVPAITVVFDPFSSKLIYVLLYCI